jgi:hypothetical protein
VELSTDQKGAIAESAIIHAAIKLGSVSFDRCRMVSATT